MGEIFTYTKIGVRNVPEICGQGKNEKNNENGEWLSIFEDGGIKNSRGG